MKHPKTNLILALLISMVAIKTHAHDIEVKNADGVTIYYKWTNNKTELSVSYQGYDLSWYENEYTGNVVIPESVTYNGKVYSVTSIGSHAFYNCTNLISVSIPNSVKKIDISAFSKCSGLTSITIPNSVTEIGRSAFNSCSGLTSITIPGSTTITGDDNPFWGCTNLKSVNISVTDLADFCNNNLKFNKYEQRQIKLVDIEGKEIKDYDIPNGVTTIGDYAFYYCSGLISVNIPNSVTSIGNSAFENTNLKSVTIGSSVLKIGSGVFGGWYGSKPVKIIWLTNTPPNGYDEAVGIVNYVANDSYSKLNNKIVYPFLSSIFEVDGVKYVPVSPSDRTCDAIDCTYNESTEKINIGNTVSYKGVQMTIKNVNQYACYSNSFIKNVDLSFDGNLGDYAFQGCTGITTVNVQNAGNIGDYAFQGCSEIEVVTFGNGITSIGQYVFDGCKQMQSIVIPDALTKVGSYAFKGCTSLTSAKIGKGIRTINQYTFSGCSSLSDIQIGNNVATISKYAFQYCSALPKIQIPQRVTVIEDYVFSGCNRLKTIIMNDMKTELTLGSNGSSPLFSSCPLDSVYIGRNIVYSTDKNHGYSPFYRNTSLRSVTITDKETEISPNEFYGCTNLKNVSIGDGVTTIGDWAFSGCSSLDYFAFGSKVNTIGKEAFSDCTAMTKLISHASIPPTCGSQALDDINKWNCTLSVPTGTKAAYQQANQWKDFFFINDDVTGMSKLTNTNVAPNHIYDLNGKKLKEPSKGINIIGGKKVVVK